MTGRVFSVQRFSLHDGPGIRTTAFLKGCPLLCPWCHNPESRAPAPQVWILHGRCTGCGTCLDACPAPTDEAATAEIGIDPARCIRCGSCIDACPSGARQMVGRTVTAADLVREIGRDRPFFEESGGGVTFSGGEPLMQAEFLVACLRECRDAGISCAVDTCGYAPRQVVREISGLTDLFLYDIKFVDETRHREETGVPVEPILENLAELDRAGVPVWVRLPLIPGVNDDAENLDAVATFLGRTRTVRRIHLLPYHGTGAGKKARLGVTENGDRWETPSTGEMEDAAGRLAAHGLDVRVGG